MSDDFELVAELAARLDADPELAAAFAALTPGRRKGYHFHIAKAKQSSTRERRIDASIPKIMAGKGVNDPADDRPPLVPNADGVVLLSGGNPQIAKGDGPGPVEDYLAAMPGWKQRVGRHLDDLIVRVVPDVAKAVRWNSPFYGRGDRNWFASMHCFDTYVKVTFLNGAHLEPPPPLASKDANERHARVHEDDHIDDAQFEDWMRQAAARPGWDGF